jgi:hypothetical protein
MYLVSFDIELDRLVKEEWETPKIICAAIFTEAGGTSVFYGDKYAAFMSESEVCRLFDELYDHFCRGGTIVSWGGCAVDFRAIFENVSPDRRPKCIKIAKAHIDIPVASSTDMGVMMSLDAASRGMGIGFKTEGESENAPKYWKERKFDRVLHHVKKDAEMTLRVYNKVMSTNPPCLLWLSKTCKKKQWFCSWVFDGRQVRMLTVDEAVQRKVPHTPFIIPPGMDRNRATKWIYQNGLSE